MHVSLAEISQKISLIAFLFSYLCLFACLCTKAVHLEIVSELTTEAFLLTVKRFVPRRGCPSGIYSDNGRIFIGASAYLKYGKKLAHEASFKIIQPIHLLHGTSFHHIFLISEDHENHQLSWRKEIYSKFHTVL